MNMTVIEIGPADRDRHMSLDDFDRAKGQDGYQIRIRSRL
jgi:hypothetical protein